MFDIQTYHKFMRIMSNRSINVTIWSSFFQEKVKAKGYSSKDHTLIRKDTKEVYVKLFHILQSSLRLYQEIALHFKLDERRKFYVLSCMVHSMLITLGIDTNNTQDFTLSLVCNCSLQENQFDNFLVITRYKEFTYSLCNFTCPNHSRTFNFVRLWALL